MSALNDDFAELVERRLRNAGGMKGMALRAGVATLAARQPDIVRRATARLLPDFVDALEPLYGDYRRSADRDARTAESFGGYLLAHRQTAGNAMMQRADIRASRTQNGVYTGFYRALRETIAQEADAIVPILAQHLDAVLADSTPSAAASNQEK